MSERARIVISREITIVLRITVDRVTVELWTCMTTLVAPYLRRKLTLKRENFCLQLFYRIVHIVHAQAYRKESDRLRPLRHWRFHNDCD